MAGTTKPIIEPDYDNKPQCAAVDCDADELFYGGAAGGGKSFLLLILALTKHRRSLLLRRENVTTKDLIDKARTILDDSIGHDGYSYNQNLGVFRNLPGDRVVEVAGCEKIEDKEKYKGREHDLKAFDELSDFSEEQYTYICQWNRTSTPGQRVRIVATGNPPTTDEGQWVINRWRCWIDDEYEGSPIKVVRVDSDGFGRIEDAFGVAAQPGELRYFAKVGGIDCECQSKEPFKWRRIFTGPNGEEEEIEEIYPTSRSFIPALPSDNKFINREYIARLQAADEPWRSMFLYGKWVKFREDDSNKIIPYSWIKAAMDRWEAMRPDAEDLCYMDCLGVDPAGGGDDEAAFAARYGNWFDHVVTKPGKKMKDGPAHAKVIEELTASKNCAVINVDAISWGQSTFDILKVNEDVAVNGINITKPSRYRDKSRLFKCADLKSEIHWRFREALDPEADEPIALPPDPELLNDLAAPTYEVQMGGIKVETKKALRKRIGRSPNKGDAVLLAYYQKVIRKLEAS